MKIIYLIKSVIMLHNFKFMFEQVVYKYRLPSAWYFTSRRDGTVRKPPHVSRDRFILFLQVPFLTICCPPSRLCANSLRISLPIT